MYVLSAAFRYDPRDPDLGSSVARIRLRRYARFIKQALERRYGSKSCMTCLAWSILAC